jgi:hypothetical protein
MMRGMEQRGIREVLAAQNGTLTKRGHDFAGGGNLVNKQRSYDPARLKLPEDSNSYQRAFSFETASQDDTMWAKVKEAFEL